MDSKKNITKKELLKLVEERLNQGVEKHELCKELTASIRSNNLDSDTIPKTIALFPDSELKEKYKKTNTFLFVLLFLTAILKVLGAIPLIIDLKLVGLLLLLFLPLLNLWFAFEVKKNRAYIYKIIGIMAIAGIFNSLSHMDEIGIWVLLDVILWGMISFLGFRLGKKMFPNYKLAGPAKNESGDWVL